MARGFSIENKLFRGVAALAMAFSTTGCGGSGGLGSREGSEVSREEPLVCGAGEIYPLDGGFPSEGSYLVDRPFLHGCAVRIFLDGYQDVYLVVYSDRFEMIVFDDFIGRHDVVYAGDLPVAGEPFDFAHKNIVGSMSLSREGNYLIEYRTEVGVP